MRIAFLFPVVWASLADKVRDLVATEFSRMEVECFFYETFDKIPELLDGQQEKFDAVLFSGHAAMAHADARLPRKTRWAVLSKMGSSILCALLNASRMGWDITKLSFDSYSEALLRETYGELGYAAAGMEFLTFKGVMADSSYIEDALRFHRDNLAGGKAVGCLTGLQAVHLRLNGAGLPNIMIVPTRNVIREQLGFLEQFHRAKEEAKGQISAVLVTIDFPSDHSVMRESDDLFIMEKMKIGQQIYRYAGQLQATVLEASLRDYLLFSTRRIIETETCHYRNFALLQRLEEETLYSVSIGIGHGDTVAIAKSNAVAAMLRAQKHGHNSAYVCMNDGNFIGPFFRDTAGREDAQVDARLLKVADATGLSVNTLYRLHCFLLVEPGKNFTSQEFAEGLAINRRSADRILQTLDEKGFVRTMGRRIMNKGGRPSRVVSIDFNGR